ncbi:unnamed protein product [Prorocentrum cordatum]|uniref:Uncharacterized protein n=1 Tax=Prorocentrum cordatum TaxID=2364126 RepID=A0ABN9XLC0_9DINO|nr:unnamed protein product [Polarella glacialis]
MGIFAWKLPWLAMRVQRHGPPTLAAAPVSEQCWSVQGYEANRQYFATNKAANQRDLTRSSGRSSCQAAPGRAWRAEPRRPAPCRCAAPEATPAAPPAEPPSGPPPKGPSSEADAGCSVPSSYVTTAPGGQGELGAQRVAAGQLPVVPAVDDNQWWSLEEERQKLLMELASVQESRRALATSLQTAPAQPVPGPR